MGSFGWHLDDRGLTGIKGLFWILVFGLAIYTGFKVAPPYFTYRMMRYEVNAEAQNAMVYNDNEISKHLLEKADYWSIPLKEENIEIVRGLDEIEVSLSYTVHLNFFNRYKRDLNFNIYKKAPIVEKPQQ